MQLSWRNHHNRSTKLMQLSIHAAKKYGNPQMARSLLVVMSTPSKERVSLLVQATQNSLHSEAIINQIQICRLCILFTRQYENQNSFSEILALEHRSECHTCRISVTNRSRYLGKWQTVGELSSKPATGNTSWLVNALYSWAWIINLIYQVGNYQAASSLQVSYLRKIVRSYEILRSNQVDEATR